VVDTSLCESVEIKRGYRLLKNSIHFSVSEAVANANNDPLAFNNAKGRGRSFCGKHATICLDLLKCTNLFAAVTSLNVRLSLSHRSAL